MFQNLLDEFFATYLLLRAKWVVGAVIIAIPIYRRFRTLEGKLRSYNHTLVKTT
jgi:hypothetical protein